MSGERNASGLASALAQVADQIGAPPTNGDQLDFLEPDTPLPMRKVGKSGPRGGRPAGAMNKSTKWWVDYLLSRYQSPLVALMELYSRSPKELAEELGLYEHVIVGHNDGHPVYSQRLATGEAFKRQVEAMIAALPYIHQKLPIAIETKGGEKGGMLLIGEMNITANFNGDGQLGLVADEPQTIDVEPNKPEPTS